MRKLVITALLLSSYPLVSMGAVEGQWTYIIENGGATITASTATGAVTIPSEVNGVPVKKVGNGGASIFGYPNSSVTSITIPNSVTSIGEGAFYLCTSLTSITIPNSVTSIQSGAFIYCTGLTSITIPNSVTSIQSSAFMNCTGLTSITIPNSVTSIGSEAFYNCSSLTSITIPNSVTSIGGEAFYGCFRLTTLTMPIQYISQTSALGISGEVAADYIINALANNDDFVTAVANKILAKNGNYGLSVKSELETLATKSELTSSLTQSRTDGINSVLSNPNLWTLYTTSQIQNMAVGDLVLTRQVGGGFVLNYDIEQSADLQTWTTYAPLSLPLTGLPTDKAFVRIKVKQDGVSNSSSSQTTPTTPTFGSSYDGGSGVSPNYATPNYSGGSSGISPDWLNSLPTVPLGPIEEE